MNARREIRSDQQGFTLIELLIGGTLTLIIVVGVMAVMLTSFRQNTNQYDRIVTLDDARNGLLQMTNEIRSSAGLNSVSPQVLDVLVHFPEDTANPYHWIRYKCVGNDQGGGGGGGLGGTCSRQDKDLHSGADCGGGGTGPGCTVILRNVTKYGGDHFAEPCDNYDPASNEEKHFCTKDNRTVQFSIYTLPPGATNPIELRTAVTIRNCVNPQQAAIPCVTSTPSS